MLPVQPAAAPPAIPSPLLPHQQQERQQITTPATSPLPPPPPRSSTASPADSNRHHLTLPASPANSSHGSQNYQGKVVGLEGWNDAPSQPFVRSPLGAPEPAAVDASAVSAAIKPIVEHCKKSVEPSQKRVLDDAEKRLAALYEKLSSPTGLPPPVLSKLSELSTALTEKDFEAASAAHVALMTGHFETEGRWLVGLKRVVELYQKTAPA